MTTLETERLTGRAPTLDDIAHVRALHKDAQVMRTLAADGLPQPLAFSHGFLERLTGHWDRLGYGPYLLFQKSDDAYVGYAGLRDLNEFGTNEIELMYAALPAFWRKGFTSEASLFAIAQGFATLPVQSLIAKTLTHNKRSRGVMEKCGFTLDYEGVHADLPHVFYRLTRADWEARR
jgi:RimJ/RimL family protein N-acetyltransferase